MTARLDELLPEGEVPRVAEALELPCGWVEEGLSRDAVREEAFDGSAPNRSSAARERVNEELYRRLIALDGDTGPDRVVVAVARSAGWRATSVRDRACRVRSPWLRNWRALPRTTLGQQRGSCACARTVWAVTGRGL